jgi:RNase P/RNase MRP subunit p29
MRVRYLMLAAAWVAAWSAAPGASRADSLTFKSNGDRLKGTVVAEEGNVVVFESERFGVLRVPRGEVTFEKDDMAAAQEVASVNPPTPDGSAVMADGSADAAQLAMVSAEAPASRGTPWHMHLAFSTELIRDTADKSEWIFELRAERKWERDELRFEPRYEYKSENGRSTSDLLKLKTYYRHDIGRWWFVQYLPYYELNRQFTFQGVPLDYQYLRNELGGGIRVIDRPGSILRVGVSESFYNIDFLDYSAHLSLRGESVFVEADLELPWRVSIRDRGQVLWYSNGAGRGIGNELEITKHLSDVWWIGIRHEYRVNAPELQGGDLSKLKVFLGVDF